MKKTAYVVLMVILSILIIGCSKGKKQEYDMIKDYMPESDRIRPIIGSTPTPIPEDVNEDIGKEGEMRSFLTGQWVLEEIGKKRPFAIQFSNFKTVRNQSGIAMADIVYEALVEGGITRLLGIGENYTGERIGSVRSSRHYFVSFADEYDAIYIHYGKTKYAVKTLKELGIPNLDGETGIDANVFYRDKTMTAPHNAFTSLKRITAGIEKRGYQTEYSEGYEPHFSFYKTDTDIQSETTANKITVKFSAYISPRFEYSEADKLFYRFQFGEAHKDSLTGNQLAYKNVIVQFVKQWDIDKNNYQTMKLNDASGTGYYFTNGKMVPITWKKNEKTKWMRYFDESGAELTINPGKTFIEIFPDNRIKDVTFE